MEQKRLNGNVYEFIIDSETLILSKIFCCQTIQLYAEFPSKRNIKQKTLFHK